MWRAAGFASAFLITATTVVLAQDTNPTAGRALARQVCATCHGIVLGAPSPAAGAPNFYAISLSPGMSPLALRVALQTPHHSMPNLMLSADEMRDITAYIMSLRPPN